MKGGVHAVGHALLAVVPLFLLCDPSDVDCEHARPFHNRPQPRRILVYDKRPGGVGVSDAMFGCHRYWVHGWIGWVGGGWAGVFVRA